MKEETKLKKKIAENYLKIWNYHRRQAEEKPMTYQELADLTDKWLEKRYKRFNYGR